VAIPISAVLMASASGFLLALNGRLGLAGWQWMFLIEAMPAVLLGIFAFAYLADGPADARWLSVEERTCAAHQLESESDKTATVCHTTLRGAFRDTRLWKISVFLIANFTAAYAYGFTAPLLIKEVTGYDNKTVGLIVASVYVFVALAIIVNGRIASSRKSPYLCIVLPAMFIVLGCLGAGLFRKPVWMICSLALISVFHNATFGPVYAHAASFLAKRGAAGGLALISSIGAIGGFVGPYYMGLAKDFLGSYQRGFLTLSIPCFIGVMLMLQLRNKAIAHSDQRSSSVPIDQYRDAERSASSARQVALPEKWRLAPTSPATFGIYLQKMCLFSERGDLIFARHGTVLASKAKREAPTEAVGCMLSVGRKGKIGIVDHGSGSCAVLARVGDLAASRGRYSPSF
jgi:ACS family tartrate transporter-like MFS transporter